MWGLGSCRWWPLVGLFFFLFALPAAFGHWGFACHKTDPGVTTDPGTTNPGATNTPTDYRPLSSPGSSATSIPPAAFWLIPLGGGLAVTAISRSRRDG